ncbi:hypothetical protein [Pseudomonas sp. 24 E 13]|uniref:glycosaminoglycan attachment site n=1 Tax=Pseudomonas sp. 24 E 13 TaxID=1844095 RepID=UPI000811D9C5|nr:glycosaminoglycan attachment site [Pseudomonas sp. 24 E 13]CRM45595.1 hypothetical protein [Pseudomonas sp. 24 E 13]
MPIDLFRPLTTAEKQHPIFKMMLKNGFEPERDVLLQWANGFEDRDGKFVKEFQTTFESSFWELYLFAALKEWGLPVDLRYHTPDFLVGGSVPFCLEATIANPPVGGQPAYGFSQVDLPANFTEFNVESTLRICNSFDSKVKKYRTNYSKLVHVQNKPFVIGIASFDRPHAHFASGRPILAALYGMYHDEEATQFGDTRVPSYNVSAAPKTQNTHIDVGLFCDDSYPEISAVIYSSLATWGKVRALADNPRAMTAYTTLHPNHGSIMPIVRGAMKKDYSENLMDGLFVLHNPFAKHPLPRGLLGHPRLCEVTIADDGELIMEAPDDFLLLRMLNSIIPV